MSDLAKTGVVAAASGNANVVSRGGVLDELAYAYYRMAIRIQYLERTGLAFQDLITDVLERRDPIGFERVRPAGRVGDRKCDGFHRPSSTVYACYASRQTTPTEVLAKMASDFDGARAQWPSMKRWVFVHNDRDGNGVDVIRRLEEMRAANLGVEIDVWSYPQVLQETLRLPFGDLADLFGYPPRMGDELTLSTLQPVLDQVGRSVPRSIGSLGTVPSSKLAYNELSEDVERLLVAGLSKSHTVSQYFAAYHDPQLGDDIAETLREEYSRLREAELGADDVFIGLQKFAGGSQLLGPGQQLAVLAVLAFFFEECDIFEKPPEGWTPE